jgi:hypothetical protein
MHEKKREKERERTEGANDGNRIYICLKNRE